MTKRQVARGDQFTTPITFTDENDVAIDLTGATIFFIVRTTKTPDVTDTTDADSTVLFKVTQSSHTTPLSGISSIPFTSANLLQTPGVYFYELQIKFSNGDIQTADVGEFVILADLNRRNT